jgi:23S rRNA maturation mini-RNase III
MINKTDLVDWAIIDYLKDFAIYKKSKRIYVDNEPSPSPSTNQSSKSARSKYLQTISRDNITQEGRGEEYIWLNYNHLINSLPLANFKTKQSASYRINKLRDLGLIKTVKNVDNTLYYTFTDKLIDICFCKSSDIARLRAKNPDPVKTTEKDPVRIAITGGVRTGITAQYKTKISILNKDTNKKTSFISSSLKPKNIKPQINTDEHRLKLNTENTESTERKNSAVSAYSAVKNIKGFTSMNGIWNVLANVQQRQNQPQMNTDEKR